MGGNISQNISNINNVVNTNIVNVLQESNNNINMRQDINAECSDDVVKNIITNYVDCVTDKNFGSEVKDSLCLGVWSSFCKMNKINVSDNLNVNNISQQQNQSQQEIATSIKNSLTQIGGDSSNQSISSASKSINKLALDIVQEITSKVDVKSSINLFNYSASYISQSSVSNIVEKNLQKNTIVQSIISNIANTITQIDENNNSIYKTLLYIIGVLIISYFLISIIMTLKRSQNLSTFLHSMLPYFIWFILALITTALHILVPPKYITFIDNTDPTKPKKTINIKKLLLYLSIYYIGFAILVFSFFKIKKLFN
jgi:hypothetical protein